MFALGSLHTLYQSAGLVGERNFGTNCTNRAVIQDKFATNTSGSRVPNACLLTIGAELFPHSGLMVSRHTHSRTLHGNQAKYQEP